MTIYNDGDFLEEALQSLINQTWKNLEIVICDNCSTDNSQKICEQYARKDDRINYKRSNVNIGEINNFNKAFNLAKGKYFMWASGHDIWDYSFVEKCVEKLEENPLAVTCTTFYNHIDQKGNTIKKDHRIFDTTRNNKFIGFIKAIWILFDPIIYNLTRTKDIKNVRGYLYVLGPDHVVRVELSLMGKFVQVPEELFLFRKQRNENSIQAEERRLFSWNKHKRMGGFYINLPHLATIHEYAKSAWFQCDNSFDKIIYFATAYLVGFLRYNKIILLDIIRLIKR